MVFALAACTEEMNLQEDTLGKDCIKLNVFNSPMTKVSDIGLEYERHLSRLDVFFYVEGQTDMPCVYYQAVTDPKYLTGAGEIPFYVVEEQINQIFPGGNTTCDVLVIANLPESKRTFDTDPDGGYANTEYNRLTAILLDLDEGEYDAIGKDFIMAGFDGNVTKDNNNNASGEVKLIRAASKVTVTVNVPEKSVISEEGKEPVTMVPVFKSVEQDGVERISLKTSFHKGVSKGVVFPSGVVDGAMSVLPEDTYFETDKFRYTFVKEIPATTADGVKKYQYACEIPFYSYASVWQKGDDHAAHLSLELPWKNVEENDYQTYYYQILINGGGRCLKPNHWYDLIVNVGVVGSSVELTPVELKDMSVYVLDWTTEPDPEDAAGGDRYEDLEIEQYTYFSVPEKRIEMNNTTVGEVLFDASHPVKCKLEWPKDTEIQSTFDELELTFNSSTKYYAYYINCRPGGNSTTPVSASLQNSINTGDFTLSASGQSIIFNYPKAEITAKVFSPVYVHAKLWLDIDGQGNEPNDSEVNFVEYVTFVYYPPMYIVPEVSARYSVFVNSRNRTSASDNQVYINGQTYDLGGAYAGETGPMYMHTISVSSFTSNDKFKLDGEDVTYIIGDPRVRKSDIHLNDDEYDMTKNKTECNGWVVDSNNKSLDYYYPTSTDKEVARVISPKFRISSKWGGYSAGDREGVAMRCASYQENGYPAGRWRVPTTAEVAFVVYLQAQQVIQDLFVNNLYFSSTHLVTQNGTEASISEIDRTDHSVRCVYDEWYWGSEQEASEDSDYGGGYAFTWGDRQIWPE